MKIAFCYPGQGVQKIGMGKDFIESDPSYAAMLAKAGESSGLDMDKLIFEENEDINITEFTQPALTAVCCIMTQALIDKGIKPDVTAGLSLGEYCSLFAAGAMSFEDAVRITRIRGRLMSSAVPQGVGMMAAIIGLDTALIEKGIEDIDGCYIANYNCPGQIVLTGKKEAVLKAMPIMSELGARKVVPLNVSGPFHSPLLEKSSDELYEELKKTDLNDLKIPYIANVTAEEVTSKDEVASLLKKQVFSSVKWEQSLLKMKDMGVDLIVEIGPGKTIAGFVKKTCPEIPVVSVGAVSDIDKALEIIKEEK